MLNQCSNWSIKKLEDMLSYARIPPAVNQANPCLDTCYNWSNVCLDVTSIAPQSTLGVLQVEIHPGFRSTELLEYCLAKGIHPSAWGPLGGQ